MRRKGVGVEKEINIEGVRGLCRRREIIEKKGYRSKRDRYERVFSGEGMGIIRVKERRGKC